jgi:hypothetical protein
VLSKVRAMSYPPESTRVDSRAGFLGVLVAIGTLFAAAPAGAEDWLLSAERAARAAPIPGEQAPDKPGSAWKLYEPPSRLFRGEIPPEGWRPHEEEDASGSVVRILIDDTASGALRALLSLRLVDRDSPSHKPVKEAVEAMRAPVDGRETTPVRTLRVPAGLARAFEIIETRRLPGEDGPALPEEVHQYVAVIPRGGESYYLVRLVSARAKYLDYRDDFVRFLRSLKPIGVR